MFRAPGRVVVIGGLCDLARDLASGPGRWQTEGRGRQVPGISGVKGGPGVTLETANEIRELQLAITAAHSEYLVLVQSAADTPLDRADFVLGEIRAALRFIFDDGIQNAGDEQLARLAQAFSDSSSQDAMALALEGYAELADLHTEALAAISSFDLGLMEEARTLARALREQSAQALTRANPIAQREALGRRNRLFTLLIDRVRRVRRTASYVYRDYPTIARKFSSAYERRRAAARRRSATSDVAPAPGVTPEAEVKTA